MSANRLSSRQQAQLAWLETLPPKFARIKNTIEQMATLHADETTVRGLGRTLDEMRANAQAFSMGGLADTCGIMATLTRRGGGLQMKVRGLRELLQSLHVHYDGAVRAASTPETGDQTGPPKG